MISSEVMAVWSEGLANRWISLFLSVHIKGGVEKTQNAMLEYKEVKKLFPKKKIIP